MNYADFSWYHGNLDWLRRRTIFLAQHGSRAYGTDTPTSDYDLKGVAVPPREYFLGYLERFEQAEAKVPALEKKHFKYLDLHPEAVIYDIRKFFKLAADANPTLLEMLYTHWSEWIIPRQLSSPYTTAWEEIHASREAFLSKKALHTFSGYAFQQIKRIETHRGWLLNPPKAKPERADFELPENPTLERSQLEIIDSRVRKLADELAGTGLTEDEVDQRESAIVMEACEQLDVDLNLMEVIRSERRYKAASRRWAQFLKWKEERNADRSALETQYGYDTKHGAHVVRLLRMGLEILEGKGVIVRRPDAEELKTIRAGAWPYDQLKQWAADMQDKLKIAAQASLLPISPNRKDLDALCVRVVTRTL